MVWLRALTVLSGANLTNRSISTVPSDDLGVAILRPAMTCRAASVRPSVGAVHLHDLHGVTALEARESGLHLPLRTPRRGRARPTTEAPLNTLLLRPVRRTRP